MSAESRKRIYDRFASQVVTACAEGRGQELQDGMIRDLAADYARTVFLRMETEVSRVTKDTVAEISKWAEQFPYVEGLHFIESVTSTLQAFGASTEQMVAAETLAAHSYRDEMDRLFGAEQAGGSA